MFIVTEYAALNDQIAERYGNIISKRKGLQ